MNWGTAATPDDLLSVAIAAARQGDDAIREALGQLPAPIYVTDAEGRITYFNPPCVDFAGREPIVGQDSWCVTWKLYTDSGEFLPHDQCPMALAIREKRAIRGASAVAERPDGSRVSFTPYPTPLFDETGDVIGAVNLLADTSQRDQAQFLRSQALRCRRLAQSVNDPQTVDTLKSMAAEYEEQALALARPN